MTTMPQTVQIAIAFTSIVFILFPLGFIIKYFWPALSWRLIPVFGLVVFGGVTVPILYLIGRFSFIVLDTIVILLVAVGLFLAVLYLKKKPAIVFRWSSIGLAVLLIAGASGMVVSLAQQPVPGGVDSAMHSLFMTELETSHQLNVAYPLGLHIFILFFEKLLNINRAFIMQALSVFLSINFFILIYSLLKRISGKSIIGWLGVLAAVLDVSFYNNLLNGSLTHILAIDLVVSYLLFLETHKKTNTRVQTLILLVLSLAIVYFHFITWYLVLPALWFQRLIQQKNRLQEILTTVVVLLLSIPLIIRLFYLPMYSEVFKGTTILIISVELLLLFFGKYIYRLFNKRWLQIVLGIFTAFLFMHYRNSVFDKIDTWYGWLIIGLAMIGLIYTSIKRQSNWIPYALLFSLYTILFLAFKWSIPLTNKIDIVRELLFYYGFTVPLVIFACMGLYCFVILGVSRWAQSFKITIVLIIVVLVFTSRISDKIFVGDGNSVSRYISNSGFGMFFQKNDVLLADWFKGHVNDTFVVANPGGLYGIWTSMTGHRMMYYGYGGINVAQPAESDKEVIGLMTNGESGRPSTLLSNDVRYLFVPQAIPVDIAHPYLKLLHQIGTSRVYKILDQPDSPDRIVTLYPLLNDVIPDVHLTGDFGGNAPLNGNRFFYQFQQVIQVLTLESGKLIQLKFSATPTERVLDLQLNTSVDNLDIFSGTLPISLLKYRAGELTSTSHLPAGQDTVITIKNMDTKTASITNIIAQLHQ